MKAVAFVFMNILRNDWQHSCLKEMNIPFVSFGQLTQDKSYNFIDLNSFQYTYAGELKKGFRPQIWKYDWIFKTI